MKNITWYLKQLLPLRYHTKYRQNGKQYSCDWNMWFGKAYNAVHTEII